MRVPDFKTWDVVEDRPDATGRGGPRAALRHAALRLRGVGPTDGLVRLHAAECEGRVGGLGSVGFACGAASA